MNKATVYRLSSCSIIPSTRELLRDGSQQQVDPKVFDLLVYLVENRARVVSRGELLEHLWPGVVVTDGVITRTVMLARKSIGDPNASASQITTVHRIGYRFVGEVAIEEIAPAQSLGGTSAMRLATGAGSGAIRLALLPFTQEMDDANLVWMELGLPSLVAQALGSDSRIATVGLASILSALERATGLRSFAQQARRIMDVVGVTCVVGATIRRAGAGYQISAMGSGDELTDFSHERAGPDPTELALDLAGAIERFLFHKAAQDLHLYSNDPFVNECFARAMNLVNREQFEVACKYLEVVVDMEPESLIGRFQYARVLSESGASEAFPVAEGLLRDAESTEDATLQAMTHHLLAIASFECDHDLPRATTHLQKAMALAPPGSAADWLIEALVLKSRIARLSGDAAVARGASERAIQLGLASGNQIIQLNTRLEASILEAQFGDASSARRALDELIQVSDKYGRAAISASASLVLASIEGWLGLFADAQGRVGSVAKQLATAGGPIRRLLYPSIAPLQIYSELRNPDALGRISGELLRLACIRDKPLDQWYRGFSAALFETAQGNLEEAVLALNAGIEGLSEERYLYLLRVSLPLLIELQFKTGSTSEAESGLDMINRMQAFESPDIGRAPVLHCEALKASLDGDIHRTRARLRDAVNVRGRGLWDAYSRIDLAWLLLKDNDVAGARDLLMPLTGWLERHPAGLLTQALMHQCSGEFAMARECSGQHLQIVGGAHATWFSELGQHFGSPFDTTALALLRQFTRLPSAYQRSEAVL